MGLVKYMAKDIIKEIGNKSCEFYEFVLPPIDMELQKNNLKVTIDIPGFTKDQIKLRIHRNILSIYAEKKLDDKPNENKICNQRPNKIDKKIRLPLRIKEGEEKVDSAKYENGVLTLNISVEERGKDISID